MIKIPYCIEHFNEQQEKTGDWLVFYSYKKSLRNLWASLLGIHDDVNKEGSLDQNCYDHI